MPKSSLVKDARKAVSQALGSALAAKASDAFVLRLAHPMAFAGHAAPQLGGGVVIHGQPFGVEAVAEASGGVSGPEGAVIEFAGAPNTLVVPIVETGVAALEGTDTTDSIAMERALRLLRAAEAREAFQRIAAGVREAIGRHVGDVRLNGRPSTELCWLNRTVRTVPNLLALAEVAPEPSIRRIGLPRLLQADALPKSAAETLRAPTFRKANNLDGSGITVAVVDTEIDRLHAAFGGRVVQKTNFTKEPWGHPDGHGTAVAAFIASSTSGHLGVAPGVTIFNYKVLAASAPILNADDFGGAQAIQRAIEDGADIVNCSWGAGPATDGTSRECRAVNDAWALGVVIVKSAGNRGPGSKTCTSPADADGVIVVGGTDLLGKAVQAYSSRGTAAGKPRPHVVAPGGTVAKGLVSALVGGGFGDVGHGTSYAAPQVSGLLALLLQKTPTATPDNLRTALLGFCKKLSKSGINDQGSGLPQL